MIFQRIESAIAEEWAGKRGRDLWASDILECPRKVLIRMHQPEVMIPPRLGQFVRMLQGLSLERVVVDYVLKAFAGEAPLSSYAGKFPFLAEVREPVASQLRLTIDLPPQIIGRPDLVISLGGRPVGVELKQIGPWRKIKDIPHAFIAQAGLYAKVFSECFLIIFSVRGDAAEHLIQTEGDRVFLDDQEWTMGAESFLSFIRRRASYLLSASLEDFPLLRDGHRFFLAVPVDFPAMPGEDYHLTLARRRKGVREDESKRCPACPSRKACYPEVYASPVESAPR